MRVIAKKEVERLLPMDACIDIMADAMRAASSGAVAIPPRVFVPLLDQSGSLGVMPGSALEPASYGAKILSLHPANPSEGRPVIQGFVTLFDHGTGEPVAIVEGSSITAIRTAAASGLATRELANAGAKTHGILGTGVQAATHMHAVA